MPKYQTERSIKQQKQDFIPVLFSANISQSFAIPHHYNRIPPKAGSPIKVYRRLYKTGHKTGRLYYLQYSLALKQLYGNYHDRYYQQDMNPSAESG
jgi:hypothetical protein